MGLQKQKTRQFQRIFSLFNPVSQFLFHFDLKVNVSKVISRHFLREATVTDFQVYCFLQ